MQLLAINCGIELDTLRNGRALGSESRINADAATVQVYVIPVDEEALIVRDTVRALRDGRQRA